MQAHKFLLVLLKSEWPLHGKIRGLAFFMGYLFAERNMLHHTYSHKTLHMFFFNFCPHICIEVIDNVSMFDQT